MHSALARACHLGYKRRMFRPCLLNLVALAAVAAAAAGCDEGRAGRPTTTNDELWKLAPDGARGAIVASPYAIGMIEDGSVALRDLITKAGPELGPLQDQLDEWLAPLGGGNVKLEQLGLTRTKGGAVFFGRDGKLAVVVLPIADRDTFLARAHGTRGAGDGPDTIGDQAACQVFGKHYACARSTAGLAAIGKGDLAKVLAKARVRGDLEVIAEVPLGAQRSTVVAAVQLERGELVVRGIVANPPQQVFEKLGEPTRPKTPIGRSAGFGVLDLRPLLAEGGPQPVAEGVTLGQLGKSLGGPLMVSVPAGEPTIELTQALSDPKPAIAVVTACDQSPLLAQFGAKKVGDGCQIELAEANLVLDVWVADGVFHIGKKGPPLAGNAVAMSPATIEMATGKWGFVLWGRGTMFAPNTKPVAKEPPQVDPRMLAPVRAMASINEAGLALATIQTPDGKGKAVKFLLVLRTAFANPADVVAALTDISGRDVLMNTAPERARPIAEGHRGSPFAADYAAGQSGLLLATYLIGAATQVIAPIVIAARADDGPPAEEAVPEAPPAPAPSDPMPPEDPAPAGSAGSAAPTPTP